MFGVHQVTETFFEEMKRFVGFSQSDSKLLHDLLPAFAPHFDSATGVFYTTLLKHARARRVFSDEAQVEPLKASLKDWLWLLCHGPHDDRYFARRWEIGKVHVRIKLAERYLFGAMNVIRRSLLDILDQ